MTQWHTNIPPLQIRDICIAYESGYGQGLNHAEPPANPYVEGSAGWQAYEIGQAAGQKRRKETEE